MLKSLALKNAIMSKCEVLLRPRYFSYLSFTLLLFAILFGPVVLFPNTIIQLGLPRGYFVAMAVCLYLLSLREINKDIVRVLGASASLGIGLYFLSDLPIRPQTFAPRQAPLYLWLFFSSLSYLLLNKKANLMLACISIFTIISAGIGFFSTTNGTLIFTDDHPCFLYRLTQLKENFPNIPFYNPLWNGGVEAREFFASGILNVFSLFAPLIYLFKIEHIYNGLVFSLLFIVPIIISIIVAKILKFSANMFFVQIVLSLSSSILWYRWGFSYGTLGFLLSSSLLPLNVVLFKKLLEQETAISITTILLYPVSLTLMFLWSPSILVFILLILFSIRSIPIVIKNRKIWTIFALTLLLNVPWVIVFYRASGVSDFLTKPQSPSSLSQGVSDSPSLSAKSGMHDISKYKALPLKERGLSRMSKIKLNFQRTAVFVNPFIIFFGILGILFFNKSEIKIFRAPTLVLLSIGLIGPLLKPQLELDRMLVMLGLMLSWPSASLISAYLSRLNIRIFQAGSLGLLALSPFWVWQVVTNQTSEKYILAGPIVGNLSKAIQDNSGNGRTLFTGFMLHELNGGHLAPLAKWTSKPLIASSYQHDRWKYVDVIPAEFRRRKEAGITEYLDLMNVSLVVAYDKKWKKWFLARPNQYEEVWKEGRFIAFKRKIFKSNYFIDGDGEILSQDGNSVSLRINGKEAVIKFNYFPFLSASNCNLTPEKIGEHTSFIRLNNCRQGEDIKIESMGSFQRFFS